MPHLGTGCRDDALGVVLVSRTRPVVCVDKPSLYLQQLKARSSSLCPKVAAPALHRRRHLHRSPAQRAGLWVLEHCASGSACMLVTARYALAHPDVQPGHAARCRSRWQAPEVQHAWLVHPQGLLALQQPLLFQFPFLCLVWELSAATSGEEGSAAGGWSSALRRGHCLLLTSSVC